MTDQQELQQPTEKTVVFYEPHPEDYIVEGAKAWITNVAGHPTLGDVDYRNSEISYAGCYFAGIHTSTVLTITTEGFETQNTIYRIK